MNCALNRTKISAHSHSLREYLSHQLCVDVALPLLRIRDTSFATLGFSATLRTRISSRRLAARNHEVQKRKRYDGLHLTAMTEPHRATNAYSATLTLMGEDYTLANALCAMLNRKSAHSLSHSFSQPRAAIPVPMSNSAEQVHPIQATISSISASRRQVPSSRTYIRSTTPFRYHNSETGAQSSS